jgi:hypothetical protein
MVSRFEKFLFYYLAILFFFSIFYIMRKHDVGNDSTVSEWLINYSGGFTKRGIIGQICIYIANFLNTNIRDVIAVFQISIIAIYYILTFKFLRKIKSNKVLIFAIYTPIFLLYPVAEIEVLGRKEIFIFCIFLGYFFIDNEILKKIYKIVFLSLSVLIWEPVIFFFIFFLAVDLFEKKISKIDIKFFSNLIYYAPALLIALYISLSPLEPENHTVMADYLRNNFNEDCYMSCELLRTKSSLSAQFLGNYHQYSVEIFFRYFLIIIFGFGPLLILASNSSYKEKNIIFFKNFKTLLIPTLILLIPAIFLFAMASDWGRWVNISYVFSIIFFIYLYKSEKIFINRNLFSILDNKKIFIVLIIIFCFGWNQKTTMTGDVATNPLWKIPYNASKSLFGFQSFRIYQNHPLSIWHKKFVE